MSVVVAVTNPDESEEFADGHHRLFFRSRVDIEARAGPPRSGCGPEPAAVRFKAACRAALRPDRTGLDMAGPRPARGLETTLLGRKPAMLAFGPTGP